ncbi:helix-turn-helix domain-containing protein [Mediterraneibacter glycyrrhizinilyticus]|uniref:helix-turn-helix domain-containing protein n=1 Tax=Mediterraneibacter glycyrrhizinilyticus TaxID=342942 RepID=UPI002ECFF6FE
MAVKYEKLFHLLIEQKITKSQLAREAGISANIANIITRLKHDQYIFLSGKN